MLRRNAEPHATPQRLPNKRTARAARPQACAPRASGLPALVLAYTPPDVVALLTGAAATAAAAGAGALVMPLLMSMRLARTAALCVLPVISAAAGATFLNVRGVAGANGKRQVALWDDVSLPNGLQALVGKDSCQAGGRRRRGCGCST